MKRFELKSWLQKELLAVCPSSQQLQAEVSWLLSACLSLTPEMLLHSPEEEVVPSEGLETLKAMVTQRVVERVPLQYLLGEAYFFGYRFKVTPSVLIPRPETELLIEAVLAHVQQSKAQRVLDLGTGSGCIAITLKKSQPHLEITAVDSSKEALTIAQENAQSLETSIQFCLGDWFEPIGSQTFDVIVSNPPYIEPSHQASLSPEVLCEPHQALFVPESVNSLYEKLFTGCQKHLTLTGQAFFEIGQFQSDTLRPLAESLGFSVKILQDYAGIDRILVIHR